MESLDPDPPEISKFSKNVHFHSTDMGKLKLMIETVFMKTINRFLFPDLNKYSPFLPLKCTVKLINSMH